MIICICHRVSDRDIQRAVREGCDDFDILQDDTRVATGCGACRECAREVFHAACARHGLPAVQAGQLTPLPLPAPAVLHGAHTAGLAAR